MVSCKFSGALAVMVTVPGVLQLAIPRSLILATAVFELLQLRPSAAVIVRLVLLVKMPVAVNPTEPCIEAEAVVGVTLSIFKLGCPAPQATDKTTISSTTGKYLIGSPNKLAQQG